VKPQYRKTILAVLLAAAAAPAATVSVPETPLGLRQSRPLVTVTSWRFCGPYKLPEQDQRAYTPAGVERAFSEKTGDGENR
jgi:hypothetical protein